MHSSAVLWGLPLLFLANFMSRIYSLERGEDLILEADLVSAFDRDNLYYLTIKDLTPISVCFASKIIYLLFLLSLH
jgi:hypothetical protein